MTNLLASRRAAWLSPARLAEKIMLLDGWHRQGLGFLAGLVTALALQPLNLLPAMVPGLVMLVWLMDGLHGMGRRPRLSLLWQAFALGWAFGFGYFLMGLWWLGSAFIVGGEQFIWLLPLGVIGLPMGLALFTGLGVALARSLWSGGALRLFALAFGLGLSEYARGRWFTGFPWNGFGQVFADILPLAQGASLIGAEGLGLVALLVFAAPATLGTGRNRPARLVAPVSALIALLGLALFGYARLLPTGGLGVDLARIPMQPGIALRVMQPNVAQDEKNRPGLGSAILSRYLDLSEKAPGARTAGLGETTHLIWPEAPLPFVLDREPAALAAIGQRLAGTVLVTGSIRAEDAPGEMRRYRFYNAIQVLDQNGLLGSYDKVHLVPFGEYLPFDTLLRALGFEQFVRIVGGFSAGDLRRPLEIPGLPAVVPLICFETIFPHDLDGHMPASGGVFVNVTNDAWFGHTFGPYQHLAQARLRAIEFGYPMVRAANSGISAMIDPHGRLLAQIPLGRADVLDSSLPVPLDATLYQKTIWYSYATVMILVGALAALGVWSARRSRSPTSRLAG